MKNIVRLRSLIASGPAVFDFLIAGILGITFISNQFLQGTFFVFYSILIFVLTLFMKPRRNYTSIPLALLVLWSFIMIFVHNKINVVPNSIINYYFNVSIMFEGFIYILAGVMLFRSVIMYSKGPNFIFALLPLSLIPLLKQGIHTGSITIGAALIMSMIIFLFLNREKWVAVLLTVASLTMASLMWPWINMKFICRPYVWIELLRQIKEHPFIGKGFNHTLLPDNMIWVRKIGTVIYGWLWAHNDYLNLAACLGAIVLVFLAWFVIETIRRIGNTVYLIPFLTIAIAACFQITMFMPDKAAVCILISAICIRQTNKGDV